MKRSTLVAVLPASLGLALVLACVGWPFDAGTQGYLRIGAFAVWFIALAVALVAASQLNDWTVSSVRLASIIVALLVVVVGVSLTSGLGVPMGIQIGVATALVGMGLVKLGADWQSRAMSTVAPLIVLLGVVSAVLGLTPWAGWSLVAAGLGAGVLLLLQGLWSAATSLRAV